jgi:hypothetical protein
VPLFLIWTLPIHRAESWSAGAASSTSFEASSCAWVVVGR